MNPCQVIVKKNEDRMTDETPLISGAELDQIGIVVHDLDAFTNELTRLFGVWSFSRDGMAGGRDRPAGYLP